MKPKTMLLMVVAVGCGLAASYMTSRLLAERNKEPAGEAKVPVLVAKQKVSPWVPIKEPEKFFIVKEVPENIAPKKAIKSFEEIKDQKLSKVLSEDSFVTQDDLINKDQQTLAGSMQPGQRAYALKVNAESLAGGFVLPGSRVDVIWTRRGDKKESNSRTILQNMLVLAIDTKADRSPEERTILGSTVTLAAKPEEVQALSLAASTGELRLSLRAQGDNTVAHLPTTKLEGLDKQNSLNSGDHEKEEDSDKVAKTQLPSKLPKIEQPAPKVEEKEEDPVKTHTMTIINGEYERKTVFYWDPVEGWKIRTLTPDEQPQGRGRGPAPAPAPAATPTDTLPLAPAVDGRPGRRR